MPGHLSDHAHRAEQLSHRARSRRRQTKNRVRERRFRTDTPDLLHSYLASFDARILGLTGSEARIAEAAKGWDAFYNKIPESDGSITIVHSAHVYLMDADNRLAGTLNFREPEAQQLAKLQALLAGKPVN